MVSKPIQRRAQQILNELAEAPKEQYGAIWTAFRMEFWREFAGGRVFSTTHGIDFFQNVVDACNGKPWEEKGEQGENFRAMIKEHAGL